MSFQKHVFFSAGELAAKKVAIYGGTFDPPHVAHAMAITALLNSGIYDYVWVVVSGPRWDKQQPTHSIHRFAMTELALQEYFGDDPRVLIKAWQTDGLLPDSLTLTLLRAVETVFTKDRFDFVIGDELVRHLDSWSPELRNYSFAVLPREGASLEPQPHLVLLPQAVYLTSRISSTLIRQMVLLGETTNGLLPNGVRSYIDSNGLYKSFIG